MYHFNIFYYVEFSFACNKNDFMNKFVVNLLQNTAYMNIKSECNSELKISFYFTAGFHFIQKS